MGTQGGKGQGLVRMNFYDRYLERKSNYNNPARSLPPQKKSQKLITLRVESFVGTNFREDKLSRTPMMKIKFRGYKLSRTSQILVKFSYFDAIFSDFS